MPLAGGDSGPSSIKKPRKPRRPRSNQLAPIPAKVTPGLTRPIGPSAPNFNPSATLDTSRVSHAAPVYRPIHDNGNYVGPIQQGKPQRPPVGTPDTALSYVAQLQQRNDPPKDTYSPYSNYAEGLENTPYSGYAAGVAKTTGYDVMNQDSPVNPDRQPSQVLTEKEVLRKLSRRGGFGIFNARGPIPGFNYEADTESFGPRVHPVHGETSNHTGEDYSSALGTPIVAPVGGKVSRATPDGGAYGNQVILDHGRGEQTMYGHMASMVVQPGQKVKKGDVIGYVGSTGLSTGPHLHWETWKDGQVMDPNTIWDRDVPPEILDAAMQRFSGQNNGPSQGFQPGQGVSAEPRGASGPPQVPQNNGEQGLAQNPRLNALMQAIREQESAGDYGVQNGIGAMGAYQVMPSNIEGPAGWDMEALNQNITGAQFLNSPELQDKIAKFKLRNYFKTYGPAGAAKAWYSGPGNADLDSDAPQYGGPSVNDYANSVLELMKKYM